MVEEKFPRLSYTGPGRRVLRHPPSLLFVSGDTHHTHTEGYADDGAGSHADSSVDSHDRNTPQRPTNRTSATSPAASASGGDRPRRGLSHHLSPIPTGILIKNSARSRGSASSQASNASGRRIRIREPSKFWNGETEELRRPSGLTAAEYRQVRRVPSNASSTSRRSSGSRVSFRGSGSARVAARGSPVRDQSIFEPAPRPRAPVPAPLPIESSSESSTPRRGGAGAATAMSGAESSGGGGGGGGFSPRSVTSTTSSAGSGSPASSAFSSSSYGYGAGTSSSSSYGSSSAAGRSAVSSYSRSSGTPSYGYTDSSARGAVGFKDLTDAEIELEYRGIAASQFPEFDALTVDNFIAQFVAFDAERRGAIGHEALEDILAGLGQSIPLDEIKLLVRSVDTDNNGSLDFGEFLLLMRKLRSGFGNDNKYTDLYKTLLSQQARWVHLFRSVEPRRTVDLALRTMQQNLIMYTFITEMKANVLITISALVLSFVFGEIFQGRGSWTLMCFAFFVILSLMAAALSVMPRFLRKASIAASNSYEESFNLLFFQDYARIPIDFFLESIGTLLTRDAPLMAESTRDVYLTGLNLSRNKFHWLRRSYQFLGVGLLVTICVAGFTTFVKVPNIFEDAPVVDQGAVRNVAAKTSDRLVPL